MAAAESSCPCIQVDKSPPPFSPPTRISYGVWPSAIIARIRTDLRPSQGAGGGVGEPSVRQGHRGRRRAPRRVPGGRRGAGGYDESRGTGRNWILGIVYYRAIDEVRRHKRTHRDDMTFEGWEDQFVGLDADRRRSRDGANADRAVPSGDYFEAAACCAQRKALVLSHFPAFTHRDRPRRYAANRWASSRAGSGLATSTMRAALDAAVA